MGLNSAIREIALSAAREVVREELKQRELAPTANTPVANGPERLLTVDDVAKLCSVTPKTVQRWIAKGLIRATRNPGMREYRIRKRDYDAFAAGTAATHGAPGDRDLEDETSRAVAAARTPKRRGR